MHKCATSPLPILFRFELNPGEGGRDWAARVSLRWFASGRLASRSLTALASRVCCRRADRPAPIHSREVLERGPRPAQTDAPALLTGSEGLSPHPGARRRGNFRAVTDEFVAKPRHSPRSNDFE
jgi:hypothetical protein